MIPHAPKPRDEIEDEEDFTYEKKKARWQDQLLLNRPLKVIFVGLLLAVLAPILVYRFLFIVTLDLPPSDGFSMGSCLVARSSRLMCGFGNITSSQCHTQCCYDLNSNTCFHRFPSRFSYIMDRAWSENVTMNPRISTVPFASQSSISRVRLSIDEISKTHLSLTFYNAAETEIYGRRIDDKNYMYTVASPELNVIVDSTQGTIFNTMRGPLIASQNIWEITFKLTDESMFGLGELPLKEGMTKVIYNHKGGMNSVPLIFAKFNDSYHGLLFDMMAPTEVSIRSENVIVVRSITSVGLKFHLFVGPKPADIMKDVMTLMGARKQLQYWMLGAHICGDYRGLTVQTAVANLRTFLTHTTTQRVPFDSNCGIIPIVFESECTLRTQITQVNGGVTLIRNNRKKFVPHVTPYIRYEEIVETDSSDEMVTINETIPEPPIPPAEICFEVKDHAQHMLKKPRSSDLYHGKVDDKSVVYPIYDNITEDIMKALWIYNTLYEGVILEDTWPLDESEKHVELMARHLPYFNQDIQPVFNETPPWNASVSDSSMYFLSHNKYANHFAKAIQLIKGVEVPTWSSSQWFNADLVVNRQNIATSWTNLRTELVAAALGGASGHWLWSSPICGDTDNYNNTRHNPLCVKWYMAATFMPMIKIHTKGTGRDPLSFTGTHRALIINSLNTRQNLLPYFFTVLQDGPLLRPMFFQYPELKEVEESTTQFNVGDDLLIVPNLQPNQSHVHLIMPPGSWFELWSGLMINATEGETITMSTTESDFLTLMRGGSIIAMQRDVRLVSEETRLNSQYSLTIALHCETYNSTLTTKAPSTTATTPSYNETTGIRETARNSSQTRPSDTDDLTNDEQVVTGTRCEASGRLYMSPNMTIVFEANNQNLTITAVGDDYGVFCTTGSIAWANTIRDVNVYGLKDELNNYDNRRHVTANVNMCALQNQDKIVFNFIP